MADFSVTETALDIPKTTDLVLERIGEHISLDSFADGIAGALVKALIGVLDGALKGLVATAKLAGKALVEAEEPILPVFAAFVAPIVANLFGTELDEAAFSSRRNRGGRENAAAAIVDVYMKALGGDTTGAIGPSDEGARRIATAAVHAALEGWFNELIPELISDLAPEGFLHFTALTGLSEEIIRALGVGRLVRRAFGPMIDVTAATPMKWKVNRLYRTTLLGAGAAVKQFTRGRWTREQLFEELARDGYSDDRIEALVNDAAKFHSVADLDLLIRAGQYTLPGAIQHLQQQGYDQAIASVELQLEEIKRIASFERAMATEAISAFADGRIGEAVLDDYCTGTTISSHERAQFVELAHARRALRQKPLTPGEAAQCVEAGVLAVADYRDALRRDGRTEDAVFALELLLRKRLDDKATAEDIRAAALAERAKEKAERERKQKEREREIEASRALARRGSLGDLKRAVVIGLIPIARYEEILTPQYDGDTVGILVDIVESDRQAYLDEQKRREEAAKRAAVKNIGIGDLDDAVLHNVLTLDQYRDSLRHLGVVAGDVDILARTLDAKKADRDAATAAHNAAAVAATSKSIDLSRFEQLVRRGVRTLPQYAALLTSLGFDEASRAGIVELLQFKIADDAVAAQLRAATAAESPERGLSLDQARRAVILQIRDERFFEQFLSDARYTADAQAVLLAELRDDVAEADAARTRRAQAAAAVDGRVLSLARVAQAARLGIIRPQTYEGRLVDEGYSSDDIAIEMQLLLTEIADVQAARKARELAAARATPPGLSLSTLANAVKRGLRRMEDFRARAVELGYSPDAVDTQVRILEDEIAEHQAAQARKAQVGAELATQSVSLDELEAMVRGGAATLDDFIGRLELFGLDPEDAEVLAGLLEDDLNAASAAA